MKFLWNGKYFYASHNSTIRADRFGNVYGGGGEPERQRVIQPPPAPEPPSATEIARQQWAAQAEFAPQAQEAYWQARQKYLPQEAALGVQLQREYAPQMQALYQQMYPQQSQIIEAMAERALGQLAAPTYETPEQAAAVEAIRGRETERLRRGILTAANIGGGLFGGRAERRVERGLGELGQAFAAEDIGRRERAQALAMQQAIPLMQILYPQITQPQIPSFYQQPVPGAESIYGAYAQRAAQQAPQVFYQQAQPSPAWGMAGQIGGGLAGAYTGKIGPFQFGGG